MDKTPHELLGVSADTQVCFCGPHKNGEATALPNLPLTKHQLGCVIWDWAMALKKMTPAQRMEQVEKMAGWYGLAE